MVDQNSLENLRAEGEKVSAVFAPDATGPNQLEIGFIGECGRFQRLTVAAAAEVAPGNATLAPTAVLQFRRNSPRPGSPIGGAGRAMEIGGNDKMQDTIHHNGSDLVPIRNSIFILRGGRAPPGHGDINGKYRGF